MSLSQEERKSKITELYRTILERDPDESGLKSYVFSDLPLSQIESALRNSVEYTDLQRRKNFGATIESLGSGELMMMGSTPKKLDHVKSLQRIGVSSLLNLDTVVEDPSIFEGFDSYLHVPLRKDEPIPLDKLSDCLNFIYNSILVKENKTFIFSERGVERAPTMVALFLIAEKKYSLKTALSVIMSKQKIINPRRDLISSDVLEAAKNFQFTGPIPPRVLKAAQAAQDDRIPFVKITETLIVGKTASSLTLHKLKEFGFDTILDLNEERSELPDGAGWFSHVHIPTSEKQLDSVLKVALRSANKYALRGKVYVMTSNPGVLLMFAENYMANFVKDISGPADIGKIRAQLVSL